MNFNQKLDCKKKKKINLTLKALNIRRSSRWKKLEPKVSGGDGDGQ